MALLFSFFGNGSFQAQGQSGTSLSQLAEKEALYHAKRSGNVQVSSTPTGQNIDVIQYRCNWWINPANDSIKGKVVIVFTPKSSPVSELTLDFANNMLIESARFRGVPVQTSFPNASTLSVVFGNQALAFGQKDSLILRYRGRPVASAFGSWSRYLHAGVPVLYSLSEPYGAKDWWPCKQALNDKADSIDVTIYTPAPNVGISNGMLVRQSESNGIRTYRWKHKYPVATYLIAVAVTNYSHFRFKAVLASGDTLPIDNYCYPESLTQWQTGMAPIVGLVQDFDTLISPYPFPKEKYGHCQFNFGGGMEHQTISFMENTDYGLQAHELLHHWFGDKITTHSMQDIWLNEGFATYFAALEYVKAGFSSWKQEGRQWIDLITQEPGGSVFCPDTTDPYRIFSGRLSYGKGAMLLRMLRWQIGDSAFWAGIRNYIRNPALAYRFTKTSDFVSAMEQASGQDLAEFFRDWYKGEGYPTFTIGAIPSGNQVSLTLNQTSSHPSVSFFETKVPILLKGFGQDSLVVLTHTQNNQTFQVDAGFPVDSVIFDPEKVLLAKSTPTSVTSNHEPESFSAFRFIPNPAENEIRAQGIEKAGRLRILDAQGRTHLEVLLDGTSPSVNLNLGSLRPGVYFLQIQNEDGRLVRKLVRL